MSDFVPDGRSRVFLEKLRFHYRQLVIPYAKQNVNNNSLPYIEMQSCKPLHHIYIFKHLYSPIEMKIENCSQLI